MSRNLLAPAGVGLAIVAIVLYTTPPVLGAEPSAAEANKLRLTGKYEEAAEIYAALAEKDADPVAAALGLARCHRAVGKLDEAKKTLEEAAKKHDAAAALPAELALLAFERGDYEAADRHIAAALKLNEDQLLARYLTAELHRVHGRLKEANAAYEWCVDYYNDADEIDDPEALRLIGLAAAQFARWQRNSGQFGFLVNTLYPDALKLDENYWPAHLEAALLFLEKYNKRDATTELNAARKINPNAAEVHAARAMLALMDHDLSRADAAIELALAINPKLLPAHHLKADVLMADFRTAEAIEVLEAAVKLNPNSEETLGRLAAAYGATDGLKKDAAGTRMGKTIDRAVARNEHCGMFFATLGETLDLMRKFSHAGRYYREATERMPQLVGVRGRLGMMHMRLGEEDQARKLLEASFKIDPFNVRVKNTLAVLDVLEDYTTLETEHFLIRYDRRHDEILARYAARYLEESVYPEICGQLGYKPPGKSLFEIFSRAKNTSGHGWFSARMVGLPYVGTVGACAGKMVAMASPNDVGKKFNWARVLKHEFVHVVNLQQTDFNIPHWYTEALAVRSEGHPRPAEWNRVLAQRAAEDKLLNLDTINHGFVRPSSSDDWTLAYCQAELYAEYMVHRHGKDALAKMLAAYADNLNTPDALQRSFGVSQEEFEKGYRQYVQKIVDSVSAGASPAAKTFVELQKAAKEDPKNPDRLAELAHAYLKRKAYPEARRLAVAARKIEAKHALAGYILARLHLLIGDNEPAIKLLTESLDEDAPQENVLALLAGLKLKAEQFDEAARLYRLGDERFPGDDKWVRALGRVYLESKDEKRLAEVLVRLAELDTNDVTVRKKLAQLALSDKDFTAAADWASQTLHVDVMDAEVHAMLAKALLGGGKDKDRTRAIEEYELAVQLNPAHLPWRFALADACVQAKQIEKARTVLTELLKRDPNYPGADVLLESLKP